MDFHGFSWIFIDVHWGAQNGWKYRKTFFYVFCLFTPLFRRFRLSRVSQTQEREEIYRLVSKILNFMPCGSVFDRFCDYFICDSMCDSLTNFFFLIGIACVNTCIAHPTAHIHRNCKISSPHRSCVDCAWDCLVLFFYPHQFCYDVLNERWPPPSKRGNFTEGLSRF